MYAQSWTIFFVMVLFFPVKTFLIYKLTKKYGKQMILSFLILISNVLYLFDHFSDCESEVTHEELKFDAYVFFHILIVYAVFAADYVSVSLIFDHFRSEN